MAEDKIMGTAAGAVVSPLARQRTCNYVSIYG